MGKAIIETDPARLVSPTVVVVDASTLMLTQPSLTTSFSTLVVGVSRSEQKETALGDSQIKVRDVLSPETTIALLDRRRRARIRLALVSLTFLVLLAFSFILAKGIGRSELVRSPLLGQSAPVIDLAGLDSAPVRTSDLSGRVFVINFWASWCVPCREEAPVLEDFATRHQSAGVELIGIVFQDTTRAARSFAKEFRITYPQAVDPSGRTAVDYGVRGVPETFVIDQRGVVMATLIGAVSKGTLDDVVRQVAGGQKINRRNGRYRTR